MKCSDVLKTLKVTRQTLCRYVKEGVIKVTKLASGRYDYDKESVFKFLNKENERKNVIYGRIMLQREMGKEILWLQNVRREFHSTFVRKSV